MRPTRLTADLSAFAGQTVRLRFAVAAHEEILTGGVDDVSISGSAQGQRPAAAGGKVPKIGFGKVKLNPAKGSAILPVKVPSAGAAESKGRSRLEEAEAADQAGHGKSGQSGDCEVALAADQSRPRDPEEEAQAAGQGGGDLHAKRRPPCHGHRAGDPAAQSARAADAGMRLKGVEPSRALAHTDLNRARLPVPPQPRGRGQFTGCAPDAAPPQKAAPNTESLECPSLAAIV